MRLWKIAAAAAVLAGTAALGVGSSSADAKGNLIVKRFLLGRLEANTNEFIATGGRGTTNAFRDNVIQFVFTAPVDFGTLNPRTIRIGVPSGPLLFIDAQGSYYRYVVSEFDPVSSTFVPKRTYRNRVIFDPTSRQESTIKQNPYGFLDNSVYSVTVPGIDSGETKVVKSEDGRPNLQTFTTTFRTTLSYLQDYIQPSIVKVEAADAPGIPLDGRTNVDSHADVTAFFTEPMLPATFSTASSFRVFNASVGRYVTGSIRTSPDGLSFTFRPAFGYGRGPSNITVTLTTAIADRSVNVLDKGLTLHFVSEYDPFSPDYQELLEDFVTNTYEDTTFPLQLPDNGRAAWNLLSNQGGVPGSLSAVFGVGTKELNFSGAGWASPPWYSLASHAQMLYTSTQMGATARTITGFAWHLSNTQPLTLGTYTGVTVQFGHNTSGSLNTNFAGSFSDTPVTLLSNQNYAVTTNLNNGGWITGPTLTGIWNYNGKDNIVLDINTANNNGPYNRIVYGPSGTAGMDFFFNYVGGTTSFSGQNLEMRLFYLVDRCEAQSKWYDTSVASPSFLTPIVVNSKPPGTVITVLYQGARPSPLVPGQVDLSTASGWVADPQYGLAGFRFIRFHVDMQSNLSSGTKPQIDALTMPFTYF